MAMSKIQVPPKQPEPVCVGEVDTQRFMDVGQLVHVTGPRKMVWMAYAILVDGGSLVFVPSVPPADL